MSDAENLTGWQVASYAGCLLAQILFAAYAFWYTKSTLRNDSVESRILRSSESFASARGSQGPWRIAWSFFAGSMGAWAITGPPNYAVQAGWLGMVSYALSCGIPIILVVIFGRYIESKWPGVTSLAEFVEQRFGVRAKFCVVLLTIVNMSVALLAELTTIGSLFKDFVGSESYPIVLAVALLSTLYTVYGGLLVSIVTDQVQAIFCILLTAVMAAHVAIYFRRPLPPDFGPLEKQLGLENPYGLSSLIVMPLSLTCSTVFSEAVWQRVWAAESTWALRFGACVGAFWVVLVVFLFGFGAFLAAWGGLIDIEKDDPNLYLFQIFKNHVGGGPARVGSWIEILVLILAATMNESGIDSIQNGILSIANTYLNPGRGLLIPRAILMCVTVVLVAIALQGYQVLSIFLVANMLCTCSALPLVLGTWDTPRGRYYVSEGGFLFSLVCTIGTVSLYGIASEWDSTEGGFSGILHGIWYAWAGNMYSWDYFAVAVAASFCHLGLYVSVRSACSGMFGHITGEESEGVLLVQDTGGSSRDIPDEAENTAAV